MIAQKFILKLYDGDQELGIAEQARDILPSVINWAQNEERIPSAASFVVNSGEYHAELSKTRTGTKVLKIIADRRYFRKDFCYEHNFSKPCPECKKGDNQ